MDERKLSTIDILVGGIISLPAPETDIPQGREEVAIDYWDYDSNKEGVDPKVVKAALVKGAVVDCSEYYGIPYVWAQDGKYRGVLLQYRNVTENHTWETVDEAVSWFVSTAERCAG